MIDKFMNDNLDMRECVRKFDENLSIKSNKIDIITMVEQLKVNFIDHELWNSLKQEFLSVKVDLKQQAENNLLFLDNIREKMDQ